MRVALTGATGFIGRRLAAHLVARGDEVRALVRPTTAAHPPGVRIITGTLEPIALREAFNGVDAVVHLAGIVSAVDDAAYRAVNVDGTRAVAEAVAEAGARLIHVSSLAAAGPAPPDKPRREDDPPAPVNAYGASKLEGERAIASVANLRSLILRPGVVYGPGDRAMLPLFKLAARGLLPMVGRRDAAYTVIHVDVLVRAIEAALDRPTINTIVFAGHPKAASTRELLEAVRSAVGRSALIVPIPRVLVRAAAAWGDLAGSLTGRPALINRRRYLELYAEGFVCAVDRLRDELGVVARMDLAEGFAETARWYRENGRL
jgi:nucleoside-diphosphate-sugar epimerase